MNKRWLSPEASGRHVMTASVQWTFCNSLLYLLKSSHSDSTLSPVAPQGKPSSLFIKQVCDEKDLGSDRLKWDNIVMERKHDPTSLVHFTEKGEMPGYYSWRHWGVRWNLFRILYWTFVNLLNEKIFPFDSTALDHASAIASTSGLFLLLPKLYWYWLY